MMLIWAKFKNHQVTVIAEHLKHKAAGVTLCSELLRGLVSAWKRGLASPGLARSLVYLFSLICCHFPSTSKNHVSFHLRIFKKATLSPSEKMFLLPGCYLHCHIFFYLTPIQPSSSYSITLSLGSSYLNTKFTIPCNICTPNSIYHRCNMFLFDPYHSFLIENEYSPWMLDLGLFAH